MACCDGVTRSWVLQIKSIAAVDLGLAKEEGKGRTMGRKPIMMGLGRSPQRGLGTEPLKLKAFVYLRTKEGQK